MAGRTRAEPADERTLEDLGRLFDEGGPEALSTEELARLEAHWASLEPEGEQPASPQPPAEPQPAAAPSEDSWQPSSPWELHPQTMDRIRAMVQEEFPAAQRDDYPLSVHEAIAEVTRRIGAVAKDGKADARAGGYSFRGIDQVLAALHPLLGDVGLLLLPGEIADHRRETRATSGAPLNVAILRVRYLLVGPDGSQLWGEAWGEGGDSGDKATQKAMSQAYKSFALQTFSIPTEESQRDEPDASNEPGRPFSADEVGRASNAWQAAQQAGTIAQLGDVRHRALALLQVPVPMPQEGGPVPLGILFDRRRSELERAAQQGGN